jgi:hypothetical protein
LVRASRAVRTGTSVGPAIASGSPFPGQLFKDRYNIVLVQPDHYQHSMVFADVVRLLLASFQSLGRGCRAQINRLDSSVVNVLLGYQMLAMNRDLARSRFIVYQLEQLTPHDTRFDERWFDLLSSAEMVWDYSESNLRFLRARGLENARHLPLGYHPALATIPALAGVRRDVDVLHYGSMNQRRRTILQELQKYCRVVHLHGVYGWQRDMAIARSKIVLNLHFNDDPDPRFEQVRISYLLNNGQFVISEPADDDPYGETVVMAPYGRIVETCRHHLRSGEARRREMASGAAKRFRSMRMEDLLRSVIDEPALVGA